MYGTILTFIKFNNFGTRCLNGPRHLFYSFCCTTWRTFEPPCVYEPCFNMDKYSVYIYIYIYIYMYIFLAAIMQLQNVLLALLYVYINTCIKARQQCQDAWTICIQLHCNDVTHIVHKLHCFKNCLNGDNSQPGYCDCWSTVVMMIVCISSRHDM